MSFPVKVDTKLCEGSMSSQVFICEQSTLIICTRHTPTKLLSYYSVSYTPIFTKSNPLQAINPINTHTKFGKHRSNSFP